MVRQAERISDYYHRQDALSHACVASPLDSSDFHDSDLRTPQEFVNHFYEKSFNEQEIAQIALDMIRYLPTNRRDWQFPLHRDEPPQIDYYPLAVKRIFASMTHSPRVSHFFYQELESEIWDKDNAFYQKLLTNYVPEQSLAFHAIDFAWRHPLSLEALAHTVQFADNYFSHLEQTRLTFSILQLPMTRKYSKELIGYLERDAPDAIPTLAIKRFIGA